MPAEWTPHQQCWMAWPCREATFHGRFEEAKKDVARVAQAIASCEPLQLLVRPAEAAEARRLCGSTVQIVEFELSDSWLRDTGPTFVHSLKDGTVAGVDWFFNAYGSIPSGTDGKPEEDEEFIHDQNLAAQILERTGSVRLEAPLILEGGSIHVDGAGTLLTTEQCLLRRNPNQTSAEIEEILRHFLGAEVVIWLGEGLIDDETSGHVDNLACFVREGVVLALTCEDPEDSNFKPLQDNLRRLQRARNAQGQALEILTVNQPPAEFRSNGDRLSRSYLNFYLANGAVIIPRFDCPAYDSAAEEQLRRIFPQRRILPVSISNLVHGGGGIHCITQQQPLSAPPLRP